MQAQQCELSPHSAPFVPTQISTKFVAPAWKLENADFCDGSFTWNIQAEEFKIKTSCASTPFSFNADAPAFKSSNCKRPTCTYINGEVEVEIPRIPSSTGSFWPAHLNDYTPSFEEDSLTMQQVLHRGPLPDDHHVNVRRSIEDPNWRPMRRLSRFSWAR